ncbi:MAG: hypothetical protein V5A55_02185 [Halovenus sp.]
MFNRLGLAGVLGFLVLLGGIAVLAWQNLFIAGGIALVLAGLGLIVYGLVTNLVSALGLGGV